MKEFYYNVSNVSHVNNVKTRSKPKLRPKSKPYWLGFINYQEALEQQQLCFEKVYKGSSAYILGCEHPTTITLGKRASFKQELHQSLLCLKQKEIPVFQTERGGLATLHSPGQLLIYPIIPLKKWGLSLRFFIESLKKWTLECLSFLGVKGLYLKEDGVYTHSGKLVFIGFRIYKGISYHGLAINVKNDLSLFHHIRVCGKNHVSLDSIQKHSIEMDLEELFFQWNAQFMKSFC